MTKLVHRAPEGRQNVPPRPQRVRRARRLELDVDRCTRRRRRPVPEDLDAQAVELLGIMVRALLRQLERARREGRELDIYGAAPYEDTTPYVRLMPPRRRRPPASGEG